MRDLDELKQAKEKCINDLVGALPLYKERFDSIDTRLYAYIEDALSNHASHANMYELLGIRKTLRLMDSYEMDIPRVQRTLRAIEGQWENGRHVKGGLKFSTPRGAMHVRLMPFQTWMIFCIYAFKVDVCMDREYHEGDTLLPTEWVLEGMVYDTRRLTQESHWFLTRKSGKTELGAAVDFVEVCFLGDVNGQALICTNSADQSQIAYKAIKEFAMQVDPTCANRMGGRYFRMTRNGLNWQSGHRMKGEIKCLSAGKTSKDGLYASVVHADEHGQARYINGASDMQSTVETAWGSTGPRREKLLLHTTTAGKVKEGPYKTKIEQVEESLLTELDNPLGEPHRTDDDYWTAMLLQLDPWEITDDLSKLDDPELFKKCNRSIGTTVQPTYYRERLHEAAVGTEDTRQEVLTKDFNQWMTGKVTKWIVTADKVQRLQVNRRVTDCLYEDGWLTYIGLDFGGNDDFMAISTLSVNYAEGMEMKDRFFADTIAWITDAALKDSPNKALYDLWVAQGWLKVCEGEVFDASLAVNELMQLAQQGINLVMFGYDPAQSVDPINNIKAWLQSSGLYADTIKSMVIPVAQNFMTMNQILLRLEYMTLATEPWLRYSPSPLWPWMAGNASVTTSRDDTLRKIVKTSEHTKVDCLHALLDALFCFDLSEGRIEN